MQIICRVPRIFFFIFRLLRKQNVTVVSKFYRYVFMTLDLLFQPLTFNLHTLLTKKYLWDLTYLFIRVILRLEKILKSRLVSFNFSHFVEYVMRDKSSSQTVQITTRRYSSLFLYFHFIQCCTRRKILFYSLCPNMATQGCTAVRDENQFSVS